MLDAVAGLPEQCGQAWAAAKAFALPWDEAPERIVVLGIGGSAIAGDYFRALLSLESAVPVFNVRQYDLPPFAVPTGRQVDERTLVVASSFSGDTEETLSAFEQALTTTARKLVTTTGGQLLATARANGVPAFRFSFEGEPRAALGWGLMPLLGVAEKLGLMQGVERDIEEAAEVMVALREECGAEVPSSRNPAKEIALGLHERLPVVYASGPLVEVARRWKTQLNESAKVWAFWEELPEAQHNAIVGLGLPRTVAESATVVLLEGPEQPRPEAADRGVVAPLGPSRASGRAERNRIHLRYEFMRRLLAETHVPVIDVISRGRGALAQMLSLTLLGDFAAAYLALLYGVDPTPTAVIDELKGWLADG
jgi:glucose/mannose-6-phosphate isomerase